MTGSLSGKRVVNSRAAHQSGEFSALLRARGAVPLEYPSIAIAPPMDTGALDNALAELAAGKYDWLLFTSTNTVEAVARRYAGSFAEAPCHCAAVGPATAASARRRLGVTVHFVPDNHDAETLAATLPVVAAARVLLPQSEIARPALAEGLTARGTSVTAVTAYRTVRGRGGVDLPQLLRRNAVDALTFTSSSAVTRFLERLAREGGDPALARDTVAACIGRMTAETARSCGFTRCVVAREQRIEGLVSALEAFFKRSKESQK